jgi:hypothetical protein
MKILIKNWYYTLQQRDYYFESLEKALQHMKDHHTVLYISCFDPLDFIKVKTNEINICGGNIK